MVAVWRCGDLKSTCTHEFGSAQCSVDTINTHWIRIEFALNSHWAIQLLNLFESGFSVDRPLHSWGHRTNNILGADFFITNNLAIDMTRHHLIHMTDLTPIPNKVACRPSSVHGIHAPPIKYLRPHNWWFFWASYIIPFLKPSDVHQQTQSGASYNHTPPTPCNCLSPGCRQTLCS